MRREAVRAYVGLGANLGSAAEAVSRAIRDLDGVSDVRVVAQSGLYWSAPHEASGPDYVNAVVAVETRLTAPDLLAALHGLEAAAGRLRPYHHAPRTLDLDLLLYGDARIDSPWLTVPHPRMAQRAFVLLPLAEIAPDRVGADALRQVNGQPIRKYQ